MEFVEIFTQMSWVVIALLSVGAIFIIIEAFVPGFGFFGITGSVALIAGVIVRICDGLNATQSIALSLFVLVFFVIAGMIMVGSARYGLLGKTGLFERRTSIAEDYNEVSKKYKKLIGKSGKAITISGGSLYIYAGGDGIDANTTTSNVGITFIPYKVHGLVSL